MTDHGSMDSFGIPTAVISEVSRSVFLFPVSLFPGVCRPRYPDQLETQMQFLLRGAD